MFSLEKFKKFRQTILDEVRDDKLCIVICAGTCGQASGSNDIIRMVKRYILEKKLHDKISLRITGCQGFCEMNPFIVVEPGKNLYPQLKMKDIPRLIDMALEGDVIEELLYRDPIENKTYISKEDIPFFKKQTRTIIGRNEFVDPIRIFDYIKQDGYVALTKVLENHDPDWIIREVKRSGLRGRGGAGFPTGKKWEVARTSGKGSKLKFVVCNADEGDPGAYMDRGLLEGNPHSIIEGMLLAGFAIGSSKGIVYVRNEYPLAVKHLVIAIRQAQEMGLLGEDILGTGISFDIEVVQGAGAFVCGEETALIGSIEGRRGGPRQRPPYPADKGIMGYPTCINNVETLANIPVIVNIGAEKYAEVGVPGNTGTKIFSLVGKIRNTGLVEVPMGITINEIIYDIGGGPIGKARIKAVQTGGPSGGCIPAELFDLPIDYDSLEKAGSIMGSGGMIVMDENTCMVDIAKYFTNFLQEESCGKCIPCREGTQCMFEILTDITEGKGKDEDIDTLEELGNVVKDTSLCGLGQTAANPLLSTIKYFKNEYIEHIKHKKCSAGVCKEIISSPCQHNCPLGTEVPVYIALIAAGLYEDALKIIKKNNPLASVNARVCHHPCEIKCKAGECGETIAIRDLKRFITDYGLRNKLQIKAESAEKTKNIKVAIIGSGPAGLTCGFFLAIKGYVVTIFEKQPVIGGMLAVGIPEYRLPKDILESDINYIKSAGVEMRTNFTLGKDFDLDDLFNQDYKAVFIATGAHKSLKLNILGEDVEGVIPGMKALTALNLGKDIEIGRRVGIIGGGNSAVDVARSILRMGKSKSITIFYRRTIAEMPAYKEEVKGALQEGIKIDFLTAPKRIISDNGKLKACEFIKMKLGERDDSGRRKPVPIEGSEFTVELDSLIVSISESPDVTLLKKERLEFSKWDTILADIETLHTTRPGVFAGGDLITGPSTVVDAAASGKIASESIDQFLSGKDVKRTYKITRPSIYIEPLVLSDEELEEILSSKRQKKLYLSPQDRKYNFNEIAQSLTEEQAVKEAKRCLRCDLQTKEGQRYLEEIKSCSLMEEEKK